MVKHLGLTPCLLLTLLALVGCHSILPPATNAKPNETSSMQTPTSTETENRRGPAQVFDCDFTSLKENTAQRLIIQANSAEQPDHVWLFVRAGTFKLNYVNESVNRAVNKGSFEAPGYKLTLSPVVVLQSDAGHWSNCVQDRFASVWEDAKLRGVDYRGIGNEPGWIIEMTGRRVLLKLDYGQRVVERKIEKTTMTPEYNKTIFEAEDMTLEINNAQCTDTMRGDLFESEIKLSIGGEEYFGCGKALH
ncbi:MAG: hypothetical protein P8N51_07185 [Pseudomonadales bacterium]|nr:hypothetical protein [Pseudomonadales bacterium]MDG1443828.1 hypothetical protein [Pseudomonadales bacterium]